jgi:hypothetical protein
VGRYLEAYAKGFGITDNLLLGKRVVQASLQEDRTWKVISDDGTGQLDSRTFDRLIVASGFFNKPAGTFDPTPSSSLPNIQHSSKFRSLSELTSSPGKVAVIGGGISGSEAAAQAAFQISNAKYAPSEKTSTHAESRVFHIINRPFYCLPRHLPQDPQDQDGNFNPAPRFLPLDLVLYNLSRRGNGEISAAISTVPPEKANKGHEFLRASIGYDLSDVGHAELAYAPSQTQHPGYTGITDTYMEFVRSGIIVPVRGWVDSVAQASDGVSLDIGLKQYEPWYHGSGKEPMVTTLLLIPVVTKILIAYRARARSAASWVSSKLPATKPTWTGLTLASEAFLPTIAPHQIHVYHISFPVGRCSLSESLQLGLWASMRVLIGG